MATAPISRPRLFQAPGTAFPGTLRAAVTDGGNTFAEGQFVAVNTDNPPELIAYVADAIALYGLSLDGTHAASAEPYTAPYGPMHNPVGLSGAYFIMNITDGSGTVGSGSTTFASVDVGLRYSGFYLATVDTLCLGLDASDVGTATKNIFQVVAKYSDAVYPDGDAEGDFNGRVIVKIIDSAIQ
jgi:hypothetical protein